MSVFVSTLPTYFRRFAMIADSEDELFAMTDRIGAARKWFLEDHFYLTKTQRKLALRYGALEVSHMDIWGVINTRRKARGYVRPESFGEWCARRARNRNRLMARQNADP